MTAPHRILIVEDNRTVARDLERRVSRLGFAVAGVTPSGEQAIALAKQEHADLVLMDIRLQGEMDGISAADHIRDELQLPVVFLTAYADDATLKAASVTEAFGYIIKPAEDRELRIVIEMALYKHAAEQQRRRLEEQVRRSEKMDAIGQLAGGIAHDFNNILMAILSNCRSLIERLPRDEKPYQQVSQIRSAAERAARAQLPHHLAADEAGGAEDKRGHLLSATLRNAARCCAVRQSRTLRSGIHGWAAVRSKNWFAAALAANLGVKEPNSFHSGEPHGQGKEG